MITVREITAERQAERLKAQVIATLSHELRTPLAGVLGFAELLRLRDLDEPTRRRYTETVHGEAQRLTALVDDFLDLERIEAGQFALTLESLGLSALLREQVAVLEERSPLHQLELALTDEPLMLMADRNRIGQLIANLLSNAMKYSPAGGPVTITAGRGDGCAHVRVSDTGVGIPTAQQQHVFTRCFRVDSSDTRRIGGTGLGLAICHEIVIAHAGRIAFESIQGEGSTFWFELPTGAPQADARQPSHPPPISPLSNPFRRELTQHGPSSSRSPTAFHPPVAQLKLAE